jgi:hypothetical protein
VCYWGLYPESEAVLFSLVGETPDVEFRLGQADTDNEYTMLR